MKPASYQSLALAWQPNNRHDKPFILFALLISTLFLGLGIFFSSIELPKEERRAQVEIPDRIAQFMLDKPKPAVKPAPQPQPKKIEKPKSKPVTQPKVQRQKPVREKMLTEKQKVARKTAQESGLIALADELSELMDTSSIDSMVGNRINKPTTQSQTMKTASVDTHILMAGSMKGSGGVKSSEISPEIVSVTKLEGSSDAMAQELIVARASADKPDEPTAVDALKRAKKERVGNYRLEEDIAYIIDKNKGKLHAIYRRIRRSDPGIQGKIILEITILPSGKVESVRMASSELQHKKLEARIIARVKQFDFGAKNVKKVTVTYPIEFLPS